MPTEPARRRHRARNASQPDIIFTRDLFLRVREPGHNLRQAIADMLTELHHIKSETP